MKTSIRLCIAALAAFVLAACVPAEPVPPYLIELTVTDPPAETERVEIQLGAEVTLRITTAIDDHAHLHGYEVEADTVAGDPTDLVFTADMAGTYELESHATNAVWLTLVVK